MKYSLILKQLQMAYMAATLKDTEEEEHCLYCWKTGCSCSNNTVKKDLFINTTEELKYV
jgi:hypothetical protein